MAALENIPHPPVSSLFLGYRREQVAHPLDGFGGLVPAVEKRDVLGILFSSTLFPGRAPEGHVGLTVFVGGMRQPGHARLSLYNVAGRLAVTVLDAEVAAGPHALRWDVGPVAAGVYLTRLEMGGRVETRRVVVRR